MIKIRNQTKKTILSDNAFEARTMLERSLGLLDHTKPSTLILETRFGVHTFALKEAIDIIILDRNDTVVSLKHSLRPNRIFLWNPFFARVIELPSGTIKRSNTEIGDRLTLIPNS